MHVGRMIFFYAGLFGVRSSFCSSPVWEIYESRPPSVPNPPSSTFLPSFL